jgi:hypothetical protein
MAKKPGQTKNLFYNNEKFRECKKLMGENLKVVWDKFSTLS